MLLLPFHDNDVSLPNTRASKKQQQQHKLRKREQDEEKEEEQNSGLPLVLSAESKYFSACQKNKW